MNDCIEREITKARVKGRQEWKGWKRKRKGKEGNAVIMYSWYSGYGPRTVTPSLTKIIQIAGWSGLAYFDWCSVRV